MQVLYAAALILGTMVPAVADSDTPAPAGASVANDQAAPAEAATPVEKAKKPRKFCRAIGSSTSHMRSSVCKTQAEWDAIDHRQGDDGLLVHREN